MALKKITRDQISQELKGTLFNVDNGDLKALEEIVKKWNFRDEESALRFALAVMKQAENETVYIDKKEGGKIGLSPSDELLKDQK